MLYILYKWQSQNEFEKLRLQSILVMKPKQKQNAEKTRAVFHENIKIPADLKSDSKEIKALYI